MNTDIFIRTCSRDAAYHAYCIKSIEKYCSGFRNVIVVLKDEKHGYLGQQIDKLRVDLHSDADYFLITDSDTLFTRHVTPETYMVDGKAVWLHTPWNPEMLAHAGTRAWMEVMTKFCNAVPPSEFMRRQPFFVPRWLTENLRRFCVSTHGIEIDRYVMREGRFTEFNVMGFYAWLHHRDQIHWINTELDLLPELTVDQMWSHDPIAKNMDRINQILA